MMRALSALLAALIAPWPSAAQKKPVTIEAVAATRPARPGWANVVWAPDGRRFAWVEDRTLWVYDVPAGQKKELLKLALVEQKAVKPPAPEVFGWENRRVAEQAVQWSASGREMLIAEKGDLFLLRLDTGAWDQLTATSVAERDPKLSPDGLRVSFRREHDLYTLEVASRKVTRLTRDGSATLLNGELDWVYPEELDLGTAHWWSPDSRGIAYLQFDVSREPVFPQVDLLGVGARLEPQLFPQPGMPNADVRLGVVAAAGGQTRWMDLADPRGQLLARVWWSPDSRNLAAVRLNRVQNRLDLFLANADAGASRVILHEEDPYWVNVNDLFRFLPGGGFLWGSERDGFRHLFLYAAGGRLERQITRGEWEVTELAAVDAQARRLYYVSTEAGPLERQLYAVGFDGKRKQRVSAAPGTHAVSMGAGGEYYMDGFSSLASPPRRALHRGNGAEIGVWAEAAPVEYELQPVEVVRFKASDGTPLYARLIKPAGFTAGRKYPAVVMVYGGPHAQNVRDTWGGVVWEQALAQRGFVVWQVDNRGTAGRGHAFESKVFRNLGAQELKDQEEGVRHLISLGFTDAARIGIHGWSYGGYMTLYALTNAPDLFRSGIAGAPVTDWLTYDTIYTERYMGLPAENAEGYRRSSPLTTAANLKVPLMLVHNISDDNVHFQNTMRMADALERAGKPFEMALYPQKTHAVTGGVRRHMLEAMTGFFEKTLNSSTK